MLVQMIRLSSLHHYLELPIKVDRYLEPIKAVIYLEHPIKAHLYSEQQINQHHYLYLLKKIKPPNLIYSELYNQKRQTLYLVYQKHLLKIYLVLKNKIKKHQDLILINRKKLIIHNKHLYKVQIFSKKKSKCLAIYLNNSIKKNKAKLKANKL